MLIPQRNKKPQRQSGSDGKGQRGGGNIEHRSGKPSRQMQRNDKQRTDKLGKLYKMVNKKNNLSGYCSEGHVEIDHYTETNQIIYNGKCNELASDSDKVKFKNNL